MKPVELALIGCGAIAQQSYLPALALVPEVRCRWLVDTRLDMARRLARRWKVPGASDDYRRVLEQVEAVVLAAPNHLHESLAREALQRRRAVLCEKPLGRSVQEIRRMVEAAQAADVPLVAGMIVRQYPGVRGIQAAFPWEVMGRIREIRVSYGTPLDWPVGSVDFFDREKAGGGVWLDLGVHALDVLWWMLAPRGGSVVGYADDGESGVEADAIARLVVSLLKDGGDVPCTLTVSRLRRLDAALEVFGEHTSLTIPLSSVEMPRLRDQHGVRHVLSQPVRPQSMVQCFAEQLRAFARHVRGEDATLAEGASQIPVFELIDACYQRRQPLEFPWRAYVPWPEAAQRASASRE